MVDDKLVSAREMFEGLWKSFKELLKSFNAHSINELDTESQVLLENAC